MMSQAFARIGVYVVFPIAFFTRIKVGSLFRFMLASRVSEIRDRVLAPVAPEGRVATLDILRGFAMFGVLVEPPLLVRRTVERNGPGPGDRLGGGLDGQ